MTDMPPVAIIKKALDANPRDLEPHYIWWVSCMTSEDLHSKSDIACVLAYQSKQIDELRELVKKLRQRLTIYMDRHREHNYLDPDELLDFKSDLDLCMRADAAMKGE